MAAFLRNGYARASVDAIAAEAGVGKQTVYGHFGNKEDLFLAVVDHARLLAGLGPEAFGALIPSTGNVRADLEAAGERIIRAVTAPHVAALHRLTIAEMTHHPQLQKSWRDDGSTEALAEAIAHYLLQCAGRRVLVVPDPALSARQMIMLLSIEAQVTSLRGLEPLSDPQVRQISRDVVDLILRAHRP